MQEGGYDLWGRSVSLPPLSQCFLEFFHDLSPFLHWNSCSISLFLCPHTLGYSVVVHSPLFSYHSLSVVVWRRV